VEKPTITKSKKGAAGPDFNKERVHCFFDVKGMVHREFVPPNTAVNSEFYCDVLSRLRENEQRKGPEIWRNHNWLLHHDNVPSNTSLNIIEFVTNNNMVIFPRVPYSPDLVPCDFALLPKLKIKLKGRRFETVSDIQRESQAVLESVNENDFHGAFKAW
jgi:transposase